MTTAPDGTRHARRSDPTRTGGVPKASPGTRTYVLLGADGLPHSSPVAGEWGGHRGARIYGRLDCPTALRALARGGYARHRVFFADEATALAAGFRPCGACCPDRYRRWRTARENGAPWTP
ncbi:MULTISPECIES: Ada metal-binding domain-containing protein [unclassified Streptomyces]|uniref:Ada metal-binding domain-containing protein n=1 Tax=unclassified Streptomyces TaxID=2593676 RepID=UPI0037F342FD